MIVMNQPENPGGFLREMKNILKEYLETRIETYRLRGIRFFSKTVGYSFWIIISLFLFFLIIIFGGLVTGLWLSELLHSYVKGFGLTTLILMAIFILLALFRKQLFVNPIIRMVIRQTAKEKEEPE
jgi:hypothetical protein